MGFFADRERLTSKAMFLAIAAQCTCYPSATAERHSFAPTSDTSSSTNRANTSAGNACTPSDVGIDAQNKT